MEMQGETIITPQYRLMINKIEVTSQKRGTTIQGVLKQTVNSLKLSIIPT